MNVRFLPLPRRVRVHRSVAGRPSGGWLMAVVVAWGMSPAHAAEEAATPAADSAPLVRTMPRKLMSPISGGATFLEWHDGQILHGEPGTATPSEIQWKNPLFADPVVLDRSLLKEIHFQTEKVEHHGDFRIVTADGSHLQGTLKLADADYVLMDTRYSGTVRISMNHIKLLERTSGGKVVQSGPVRLLDNLGKAPEKVVTWYLAEGGAVVSPVFNQVVHADCKVPEKMIAEIGFTCESRPDFQFTLAHGDRWCTVETWGEELVLTDGLAFASAGPRIRGEDRSVQLRLTWDNATGTRQLFDASGEKLAELTSPGAFVDPGESLRAKEKLKAKSKAGLLGAVRQLLGAEPLQSSNRGEKAVPALPRPKAGVTFHHRAAAVTVNQFSVAEWNGMPPQPVGSGEGVTSHDGTLPGTIESIRDGTVVIQKADGSTVSIPLSQFRKFCPPGTTSTPVVPPDPAHTDLWFREGDFLTGRLLGIRNGVVSLKTTFSPEPLSVLTDRLRSLCFALEGLPVGPPVPATNLDFLAVKEVTIRGRIHPQSDGPAPGFQVSGALLPNRVVPGPDMIFTFFRPPPTAARNQDSLLHLKGGESVPVTLKSVTRKEVQFAWSGNPTAVLAPDQVEAVQFPGPVLSASGFDGPGWRPVSATGKQPELRGSTVTLSDGAGITHSQMMQGSFQFLFKRGEGAGGVCSLRMRLFYDPQDPAASSSFLIGHFGSTIYAGRERGEGQLAQQSNIEDPGDQVPVRVSIEPGKPMEVLINGVMVSRFAQPPKANAEGVPTKAWGISFESASLWGNDSQPVQLSDFKSEVSPFFRLPPAYAPEARDEALRVPRLRREDPPRHILIGSNGDLLRGEIEGLTATHLGFRSGVESFKVPMDRLAAAVWVKPAPPPGSPPADPNAESKKKLSTPPQEDEDPFAPAPRPDQRRRVVQRAEPTPQTPLAEGSVQWVDLLNGGRIALKVESWDKDFLHGKHPLLGQCRIGVGDINVFRLAAPPPSPNQGLLAGWTLENTPDPVLPEAGGTPVAAGKKAELFELPLLETGKFDLGKQKGKVVVIDFWASWCGPCVKMLPGLMEELKDFPAGKVAFIGVNQGESRDTVKKFLAARDLNFPVAMDADQEVARKYGVEGIPHTVVVAANGEIAFVKTGFSPDGAKAIATAVQKAIDAAAPPGN